MSNPAEERQDDDTTAADVVAPEAGADPAAVESGGDDTFSREYVEQLRGEAAEHRTKARDAEARTEAVSRELFAAKVAATGRLADPTDLPYSAEALTDSDVMNKQIDDLLAAKPHFGNRTPTGNVGVGVKDSSVAANGSGWLSTLKAMV